MSFQEREKASTHCKSSSGTTFWRFGSELPLSANSSTEGYSESLGSVNVNSSDGAAAPDPAAVWEK